MSGESPAGGTVDHESLQTAAKWFALLSSNEVGNAERQRWQGWLDAAEAHREAWRYVERVSGRFARLGDGTDPEAAEAALDAARRSRISRRRALKGLAVLLGAAPLAWATWRHTPVRSLALRSWSDHSTALGDIAQRTLSDGTRVWLNTASAIDVAFGGGQRLVHLVTGEVLVETAPRVGRPPLRMTTPGGDLRALGTRFNVRLRDDATELTVLEGAVEIEHTAARAARRIEAGRATRFSRAAVEIPWPATEAVAAWRDGVLVADHMPLGELVTELARYRHGHLGVDPAIANMPVMGTYPLDDTDRALAMLADALPVHLWRPMPWWVTLEPATA